MISRIKYCREISERETSLSKSVQNLVTASLLIIFGLSENSASADILSDARQILGDPDDVVSRWDFPPKVTVIQQRILDQRPLLDTMANISVSTELELPEPLVVTLSQDLYTSTFFERTRLSIRRDDAGEATIYFSGSEPFRGGVEGDIFIFYVSMPVATYFMAHTNLSGSSNTLQRKYAASIIPCYYRSYSRGDSIGFATIFINPLVSDELANLCVYEELMQAMGLSNDAEESVHFSFDDEAVERSKSNDLLLLRSLYDSSLPDRATVEDVVELFASYLDDE